jgi:NTE family protein
MLVFSIAKAQHGGPSVKKGHPMPFGSEPREAGIGLALSGGGFRAVLFHIGSLWRLNELGILGRVNRISSVSGGSIASGHLAVQWNALSWSRGRATNFDERVVQPLRAFCRRRVDVASVISGTLNPFKSAGAELADAYRKHLGLGVPLQSLPDAPRFVFNSTNYATGTSFRFSKPYCGDYRIGLIENPKFDVALAVACSSAFPPVLAPIEVDTDPADFKKTDGADLWDQVDFRRKLLLADGGVYDNMALETVWGRYETVLVSDAGKPFELDAGVSEFAPKQIFRVMDIALNQALALRKRMLVNEYQSQRMHGAFWAINTPISQYAADCKLPVTPEKIRSLSTIRTRLDPFSAQEQCELINWGHAVTDSAIRTYAPALAPQPENPSPPYAEYPLG